MKSAAPRSIARPLWWAALVLHLAAGGFMLDWLGHTDLFFGHYTGPPSLLFPALALTLLALLTSVAWFVALALLRPARGGGRVWLQGLVLAGLCLLGTLSGLIGASELPRAEKELRYGRVEAASRRGAAGIPDLVRALDDPSWTVRQEAATSLGILGPAAAGAVEPLSRKQRARVRSRDAVDYLPALKQIDPDAARRTLGEQLHSTDPAERVAAASGLWELERKADVVTPVLARELSASDPEVRRSAAEVMGKIGPPARGAIPALRTASRDPAGTVRIEADLALGHVSGDRGAAAHSLAREVGSGDADLTYVVARKLLELGPGAHVAVPDLIAIVQRGSAAPQRGAAAHALGELGPVARAAVPALRQAARDPDSLVRSEAEAALRQVQPGAGTHP